MIRNGSEEKVFAWHRSTTKKVKVVMCSIQLGNESML